MNYSQKLADAVKSTEALRHLNPLDVQRWAIHWLLRELDKLEARIANLEGDAK